MELLRGKALDVHATSRVSSSGSGDSLAVFTRFIAVFSLSGRQVQIVGRQPPVVYAGDDVVLVGEPDRTGIMRAICYINVTRGVGNVDQGPFLWILGGVLALVLSGIGLLSNLLVLLLSSPEEIARSGTLVALATVLPTLGIFLAGSWMLRRGRRIARAIRMIRDASKAALRK
ncbi:hypothetical protein C3942_16955 [Solimonas fluminis]|jgi:hypothetical protein|uniref:Uncharacterized protein n=1 Tax=Solimonas fluminis TaxID=2086571 RepID=A0A2S5TD26_9GAMM|nr:hypothetical protein [Solimonas fluminis]PPE72738.1 hypothetical protein C3942_16955 [Solimonas fluminis]